MIEVNYVEHRWRCGCPKLVHFCVFFPLFEARELESAKSRSYSMNKHFQPTGHVAPSLRVPSTQPQIFCFLAQAEMTLWEQSHFFCVTPRICRKHHRTRRHPRTLYFVLANSQQNKVFSVKTSLVDARFRWNKMRAIDPTLNGVLFLWFYGAKTAKSRCYSNFWLISLLS